MLWFRQMEALQKLQRPRYFHNHVHQERHLVSRGEYKTRRAETLASNRSLLPGHLPF